MNTIMLENDIKESEYNYYKQNCLTPDNNEYADYPSEISLEQLVYDNAGEDILPELNSINNPLANLQDRAAFQEIIAAQVQTELQYNENTSGSSYNDAVSESPAVGISENNAEYQPVMLGSGENEVEITLPGSKSEDEYQPTMLGSGENEVEITLPGSKSEDEYQPTMLGSGENEVEITLPGSKSEDEYQPTMLGSGENDSNDNQNNKNDNTVHLRLHHHSHSTAKSVNKTNDRASEINSEIKHHHNRVIHKAVKSHKKLTLNSEVHSTLKNMSDQLESSIKENIKNNRNNSREMYSYINKDNDTVVEKIAQSLKNGSDSDNNMSENDYTPKHKENDLNCQCPTCKNRRFVDRSNDIGVSFSSPQKMNSAGAMITARNHEAEHVSAEYRKAFQEGRTIVRQSVTIYTRSCPDCGAQYVAGGVTRTVTKMRADVAYKKAMKNAEKRAEQRS